MKDCKIEISDVENGWLVSVMIIIGDPADGELGSLGFFAMRNFVCKSWTEVLATLASLEERVTTAQETSR